MAAFRLFRFQLKYIELDRLQLCLSGLGLRGRLQANAAVLGASLLMEDVLSGGGEAAPVRLRSSKADLRQDGEPEEVKDWVRGLEGICRDVLFCPH